MVENTRSQEMKHMDDAIRRNAENTEKHAEALEGIKNSIEGLTLLITTLNAKYESLSEKVTLSSSSPTYQQPPLLINPHLNDRGFQPKLDFPKFFGEDPESWIYKCEIFGGNAYEDAVGQLTKLKQWSSVKMYQEKFEELANKTTGLSEEFFISCFVCGLKKEIMSGVKMLQPRTIAQAMGLARLQEETIDAVTKKNKPLPKFIPKSVPINIPQTNFQENEDFIQCAIIEEIAGLKQSDMRGSSRELKEIHNSFELLIKEMDSEEVEMENGHAKVELQSGSGHATDAESSYLVDSFEYSEKVLILKNHSVSNSHHSPFLRHRSDRTLDSRNTWVQCQKFKNDQLCVCQRKPHVICHFRTWDDGTIKIWHSGDSAILICYVWICKAALTGIWDPGGIILENLTVSWGQKARKCREATSTPTVRSIVKVSEPLVGMGNTKGNDGLKPWCTSTRQIQDSCSSKAVKYSRVEVADVGSRAKNDATAKYIQTLTYHQLGCIFSDSHHEKVEFFQSIVIVTCMIKGFAGGFCKFWWFRRLSNSLMLGIFLKFKTHIGSVHAVFCFRILLFLQVVDTQYMDDVRYGCYERGLIYVFGELGLWDCARKVFGEMLGPYLATDITILNATAESLVLLVVVYIHISVTFHLILKFFSTIRLIIVNDKCPNQSFMQFLARQHSLLRAAFEQFNLVFFEAHYTHISVKEASKVAAPRKKIVEKINVVEVGLLIDNLMFVEAKDRLGLSDCACDVFVNTPGQYWEYRNTDISMGDSDEPNISSA